MEHRGVNLLQLKMCLPVVRTSALTLLLSLIAGPVAMVTAGRGITCQQEIPAELIRDLWCRTKLLIDRLPSEETSKRLRLLPKFCTKCSERAIGWLEICDMIDSYQRNVFSREIIQELLPPHYNDLLYRLQYTLHHCVSTARSSKWLKTIKKLERKIKKRRDDVALKAVGEFTYILRWIDELAQHHIL